MKLNELLQLRIEELIYQCVQNHISDDELVQDLMTEITGSLLLEFNVHI